MNNNYYYSSIIVECHNGCAVCRRVTLERFIHHNLVYSYCLSIRIESTSAHVYKRLLDKISNLCGSFSHSTLLKGAMNNALFFSFCTLYQQEGIGWNKKGWYCSPLLIDCVRNDLYKFQNALDFSVTQEMKGNLTQWFTPP